MLLNPNKRKIDHMIHGFDLKLRSDLMCCIVFSPLFLFLVCGILLTPQKFLPVYNNIVLSRLLSILLFSMLFNTGLNKFFVNRFSFTYEPANERQRRRRTRKETWN